MSKVIFDGVGEQPELNRITAKKNYASSSQSHKMGATAMFNDILHYLAKEKYPNLLNEVGGNVAVRQHPVYAFEKTLIEGTTDQYNRKFIGLYTVGADKGDKGYFGFTDARIKDKAIRLEGTDHLKGVGFNYPWEIPTGEVDENSKPITVKNIRYNHDKEALCIVTGDDPTKWTTMFEQSYCGTAKKEAEIEAYLEAKFKPAYDCAYYNNPLLVGTDMTLEQINADTEAFGNLRRSDFRPYSQCEFWIDGEYDVYYLNQERGVYEKNGINILTDLGISESSLDGLSIEEKNDKFVEARVARFKSEASEHYCIDDAIYQLMFLYIIVATDNFEKNMYPYLMDSLWRFFQDDLDSIFSTDNQGQDTKKYSAELHDFTDDRKAAYVFKGEDSALWQLIERAYPNECKKMGRDILQAMYEMATSGTTTVERLMSFFDDYFFSRAQNYFTPSAYNNDTEYAYEEAWNNKEYVASVDIHPLAQALGSHETTERAWLEKRIIFLMSKFGFGGYASASDTSLGVISVRTQVKQSFTLTPAIDSYPTMLGGQSQVASAENRVMAGESVELKDVGEGNTNIYFVGADWLSDIGDLKDIKIDPSSDVKLSVSSKRLRRLKVGDKTQEVTSYLPKLEVMRCDSLESVDARRLASLVGTVDLSQCPRLIEAFFGGTNVDGVKIAKGSKIERLQLPDSVYSLDLQDVKFLETFELGTVGNLAFLRIENVPSVNGFAVLKSAYNTDGQRLKDIRLIGFSYNGDTNDVTMLSNIASDKDKDGNEHAYNGIDSNGVPNTSNPELQGTLNISGGVYEEDINKVLPKFPSLTINYDLSKIYMFFADPEVLRVLLANNVGDGTGITTAQAAAVTSIGTWFKGNTVIETFDEFEKFTGVTSITTSTFEDCTNLKNIDFPNSLTTIGTSALRGVAITSLVLSTGFKSISKRGASNNDKLEIVDFPETTESIGDAAFVYCPSLNTVICRAITPPALNSNAFGAGVSVLAQTPISLGTGYIYVPDASVTAYREASGWSSYADRIKTLSEYIES